MPCTGAYLELHFGIDMEEVEQEKAATVMAYLPEWSASGQGCDGMTDAFRQRPVHPEHQGMSVICFYSTKERQ